MLRLIPASTFVSFSQELQKLAEEEYKKVQGAELLKGIPFVRSLPANPTRFERRVHTLVDQGSKVQPLGYTNIAVGSMPDLEEMGFRKTRMATPLPGEGAFSPTWRKGDIHVHKLGPIYLMHRDKHGPERYLSFKGLKHGITEGIPSLFRRLKERTPLVKETEK
jgi:hypothetical protein